MGFAFKRRRRVWRLMTPTDKVLLEGRGFTLSHPSEDHTSEGFLLPPHEVPEAAGYSRLPWGARVVIGSSIAIYLTLAVVAWTKTNPEHPPGQGPVSRWSATCHDLWL